VIHLFPRFDDAPDPFPAVTDRNLPHWADEGASLLDQTAAGLGLDGTRLDARGLRLVVHNLVAGGMSMLKGLTGLLVKGVAKLGGWFKSFLGDLVPRQFAAGIAALGRGGAVSPDLTQQVNQQAGFLARFRDQIANAAQILDGTALTRAGQYSSALWGLAQNLWRHRMLLLGYAEERRILGVADHCDGCLHQARLLWQPIGTLLPIGATVCKANCRCWFEFQ
jgi:hypothetical protein